MLLGEPAGEHLVSWVTSGERGVKTHSGPRGQALVRGEEDLADVVEGITLASAVSDQGVLGAPAHLVDGPVGEAHDMERIGHDKHVIERRRQAVAVGLERVDGDDPDTTQPVSRPGGQPVG